MAIPTTYTEYALAEYMLAVAGKIASDELEWNVFSFDEAVNEALLAYGEDDIAVISGRANINRLRIIARREAWRAIAAATAHEHDFGASSPGSTNTRRSQIHEHARKMAEEAAALLVAAFPDESASPWAVGVASIDYGDPYQAPDTGNEWSRID